MPATKRKSDGPIDAAFSKKPRTGTEETMKPNELQTLSKEELIETVKSLQQALREAHDNLDDSRQALKETSGNATKATESTMSPEMIAERTEKVRDIARKEIKKQMKWQPSCKQGTTKWSYTGIVPNFDVLRKVIGEDGKAKAWKMKKISSGDFHDLFGSISASCRYNDLRITGENVTVRWKPDESTFQLSGTYGI